MDNELIELRRQIAEAKKALAAAEKRYEKAKAKAEAARKKERSEAAKKARAQARKEKQAAMPKAPIVREAFGFKMPKIRGNVSTKKLAEAFVELNYPEVSKQSRFKDYNKKELVESIDQTIQTFRMEHEDKRTGKTVYDRNARQSLSYALEHSTNIATPQQVGNRAFLKGLQFAPAVDANNRIINESAYNEFVENYLINPDGTTEGIDENRFKREESEHGLKVSYARTDGTKVYFELRHGIKASVGFYIYDEI